MKKVLVIDDARSIREEIVDILIFQQYEVLESCDILDGIQIAQDNKPELIICDISNPDMTTFQILSEIKSDPLISEIPLILVVDRKNNNDIDNFLVYNMLEIVFKPFRTEELLSLINSYFQENSSESQKVEQNNIKNKIFFKLPNELLAPLTSIIGFTELFEESCPIPQNELKNIAKNITLGTHGLKKKLENLIVLFQVEIIDAKYGKSNDLNSYFILNPEQIILLTSKKVSSRLKRDKDLILNLSNAELGISSENLEKIIEELVDNAFRFSFPDTPVHIDTIFDDNFYTIKITNKGKGIDSESIEKLYFENHFTKLFSENFENKFGLIMVKRIVDLHGGEFIVKSIPDNETTISIKLKCNNIQNNSLLSLKEKYIAGVTN